MSHKSQASVAFKSLADSNFAPLKRGDIILANSRASLYNYLISLIARIQSGQANATHCERYLGGGLSISTNVTVSISPIQNFFKGKHDVFIFSNSTYTLEQRNQLVAESLLLHGKIYDFLGVFGQGISFILKQKIWSKLINSKAHLYCSEFIQEVENKVSSAIPLNFHATPDDLHDFLMSKEAIALGWLLVYKFTNM